MFRFCKPWWKLHKWVAQPINRQDPDNVEHICSRCDAGKMVHY